MKAFELTDEQRADMLAYWREQFKDYQRPAVAVDEMHAAIRLARRQRVEDDAQVA